MEDFH